jgi:hypothetical protein
MYYQVKIAFKDIVTTILEAKSTPDDAESVAFSVLRKLGPSAKAIISKKRGMLREWKSWLTLSVAQCEPRRY